YDMYNVLSPINYLSCHLYYNRTACTKSTTLSLHDALPICNSVPPDVDTAAVGLGFSIHHVGHDLIRKDNEVCNDHRANGITRIEDRKSTRLNSSHVKISYAVFCLKKKKAVEALKNRTNREI